MTRNNLPPTTLRRVVTGHDSRGAAVFRSDDELESKSVAMGDARFTLVWTTAQVPAENDDDIDGATRDAGSTIKSGSVLRVVDIAPGKQSPMHRSHSIDYGLVLAGEIHLELDGGEERRLSAGDVIVQRGTNHRWVNRSETVWARIAFILIEALPLAIAGETLEEIEAHV